MVSTGFERRKEIINNPEYAELLSDPKYRDLHFRPDACAKIISGSQHSNLHLNYESWQASTSFSENVELYKPISVSPFENPQQKLVFADITVYAGDMYKLIPVIMQAKNQSVTNLLSYALTQNLKSFLSHKPVNLEKYLPKNLFCINFPKPKITLHIKHTHSPKILNLTTLIGHGEYHQKCITHFKNLKYVLKIQVQNYLLRMKISLRFFCYALHASIFKQTGFGTSAILPVSVSLPVSASTANVAIEFVD